MRSYRTSTGICPTMPRQRPGQSHKSSDHSVVILTGDVHFGRVACGELKPGSETMFVEVISSPMQAVLSDKDEPLFGSYKNAPTNHFPITESHEVLPRRNHFDTVRFF